MRPLFDEELVASVRHHHERYDGGGYPDGLAGEEIPLVARALCVVDCYDAMSCQRPYRAALSYEECLAELRHCSGTQFDPAMVKAFRCVLRRLERQRARAGDLAREAAELIDPAAHALLRTRADESRPEYAQMVLALRAFRDQHPPVRFITTFARDGGECITVLDTGESDDEISRCGDPWPSEDAELTRVLGGDALSVNVLDADAFGVWVTGIAPVRDESGKIIAAISVDATGCRVARQVDRQ